MTIHGAIWDFYERCVDSYTLSFTASLQAIPKGRPRFSGKGHAYTPERTRVFEERIRALALSKVTEPVSFPVSVTIEITQSMPKRVEDDGVLRTLGHLGFIVPSGGDLDNRAKAVMDAINGVVFHDDKQVNKLAVTIKYGEADTIKVSVSRNGLSDTEIDQLKKQIKASHGQLNHRSGDTVG